MFGDSNSSFPPALPLLPPHTHVSYSSFFYMHRQSHPHLTTGVSPPITIHDPPLLINDLAVHQPTDTHSQSHFNYHSNGTVVYTNHTTSCHSNKLPPQNPPLPLQSNQPPSQQYPPSTTTTHTPYHRNKTAYIHRQ